MRGFSYDPELPQLDITQPDTEVEIEIDSRGVLYVSLEGRTVLRICRIPKTVRVIMKSAKTRTVSHLPMMKTEEPK